jgi:hypothetical protein
MQLGQFSTVSTVAYEEDKGKESAVSFPSYCMVLARGAIPPIGSVWSGDTAQKPE